MEAKKGKGHWLPKLNKSERKWARLIKGWIRLKWGKTFPVGWGKAKGLEKDNKEKKELMTRRPTGKLMMGKANLRLRDKVFVLCGELELVVVGQFWRWLHHDLLELFEGRRPCFVGKLPSWNLEHWDTKAPDVGAYVVSGGVSLRVDTLGLKIRVPDIKLGVLQIHT